MKQLSAIFLVLAMVLALTACGKDDDRNNGGSPGRPDTNQSQNAPQDNGRVQKLRQRRIPKTAFPICLCPRL